MSPNPLAVRCPTCSAERYLPCHDDDGKPSRPHDRRFLQVGYDRSVLRLLERQPRERPP